NTSSLFARRDPVLLASKKLQGYQWSGRRDLNQRLLRSECRNPTPTPGFESELYLGFPACLQPLIVGMTRPGDTRYSWSLLFYSFRQLFSSLEYAEISHKRTHGKHSEIRYLLQKTRRFDQSPGASLP